MEKVETVAKIPEHLQICSSLAFAGFVLGCFGLGCIIGHYLFYRLR